MSPRSCFRLRIFPPHLLYQPGDCRLTITAQCVCGWVGESLLGGKWSSLGLKRVFSVMSNCVLVAFYGIRKWRQHIHDLESDDCTNVAQRHRGICLFLQEHVWLLFCICLEFKTLLLFLRKHCALPLFISWTVQWLAYQVIIPSIYSSEWEVTQPLFPQSISLIVCALWGNWTTAVHQPVVNTA